MKKFPFFLLVLLVFICGFAVNIGLHYVLPLEFDGSGGLIMLSFITGTCYICLVSLKVIPEINNSEKIIQNWFQEDGSAAPLAFTVAGILFQSLLIPLSFIGNMVWILLTGWLLMKRKEERNLVGKDRDGEHVF